MSLGDTEEIKFNEQRSVATFSIDGRTCSKGALLRACYWLSGDLHFRIYELAGNFKVVASLRVIQPTLAQPKPKIIEEFLPDFFEALLDAQLRVEIQAETAGVRELIIAKAFAESGILEDPPPGTFEDPVDLRKTAGNGLVHISSVKEE